MVLSGETLIYAGLESLINLNRPVTRRLEKGILGELIGCLTINLLHV